MLIFGKGEVIDGKYLVDGLCSSSGGMGTVLFVTPLTGAFGCTVVLKYCSGTDEEYIKRFRREVRLLGTFKGNTKVVQIFDQNLEHEPPYFVMKYYPDGDLSNRADVLRASFETQEKYFLQMVDCIQELHSRNEYHRDIKPQNFLLDGDQIVVSDFGLSTEVGSGTAFTSSSVFWGTQGYMPPEFMSGGFKNADASGDVFMLGKTMYAVLTGRDPMYIVGDGVPPPLLHVIERCCSVSKDNRYQSLSEVKQSLVAAYDVLLNRGGPFGKAKHLLSAIEDQLKRENRYDSTQVMSFVEQLSMLEPSDQIRVCRDLWPRFFSVMAQAPVSAVLPKFLSIYEALVEGKDYAWSFAEIIANNMTFVFNSDAALNQRARALHLAIRAAYLMNRFAAMDTCRAMVQSVTSEPLGFEVAAVLLNNRDTFIAGFEPSECASEAIRSALLQIKKQMNL